MSNSKPAIPSVRADKEHKENFRKFQKITSALQKTRSYSVICFNRFNHDFKPPPLNEEKKTQHALKSLQDDNVDISHWLPDSGASSHMTDNLNLFDHYKSYATSEIIYIGNGRQLTIEHIGQVILQTCNDPVILKNVLHVPLFK